MKIDWKLPDAKGFVTAAGVGLSVLVLPGCLERIIKVDTPPGVVERGYEEKYSVADVDFYQDKYAQEVDDEVASVLKERDINFNEWNYNEKGGRDKVEKWSGIVDYARSPETIAGFAVDPVGASLSFLSFITGLGFRRRSDVTPETLRKEKEDSYNAGLEKRAALEQAPSVPAPVVTKDAGSTASGISDA